MLLNRAGTAQALDPIHDTRAAFRTLLDAIARPGTVHLLPVKADGAPTSPHLAMILLALCDLETSLLLDDFEGSEALGRFLRQRISVPEAPVNTARFVVTDSASLDATLPALLRRGTLEYPDEGATLIVLVDAVGTGTRRELTGPGCPPGTWLAVDGLPEEFFAARNQAVADYPTGIDVFFVDRTGRIAALPRSTSI